MTQLSKYSIDEVAEWIESLGLKSATFVEFEVDGEVLCSITKEELTEDLGLTNLQAKKVLRQLKLEVGDIVEPTIIVQSEQVVGNPGVHSGSSSGIESLRQENAELQRKNAMLEARVEALEYELKKSREATPVAHAYPAQPHQPYQPPPSQYAPSQQSYPPAAEPQGPSVVGGAAFGAAGGAAKGAVAGAILPGMSASDGAKAGAAVGALTGGVKATRNRRTPGRRIMNEFDTFIDYL
jgi:cell division protein FtsB